MYNRLLRSAVSVNRSSLFLSTSFCSSQSFKTFQHQDELPSLPVPDLNETCELYLQSIIPLTNSKQYETTKKNVELFLSNEGKILQQRLLQHADKMNKNNQSWLEQFWLDAAYLTFREALPTNSNYYILFDNMPRNDNPNKIAAKIISGALEFKHLIETEQVKPEYLRRTTPQCMGQYKKIFSISRIPRPMKDELLHFTDSKHITVICNEQFFFLTVLDENNHPYHISSIEKQLHDIFLLSEERKGVVPAVGVISALHRDNATSLRTMLEQDNKEILQKIDNSLFAVTLDQDSPNSIHQAGEWINGGNNNTAGNRWFEKISNFVIFKNGWSGLSGEHCPLDAPIVGSMTNHFLTKFKNGEEITGNTLNIPTFETTNWNIDSTLGKKLNEARKEASNVLTNCELQYVQYNEIGADWIKKVAKTSPDAFMQMSIQLAYFYTHNASTATYETGTSRCFFHGRTDTVRTLSLASKEWTESMTNNSIHNNERLEKLRIALGSHSKYMGRAVDGKVIDRHLLGLRLVRESNEPIPELFSDPIWRESTRFRLSTSNMTSEHYVAGFGPTELDGYGVCYGTRKDSLQYSITSFRSCSQTNVNSFANNLWKALDNMRILFKESSKL